MRFFRGGMGATISANDWLLNDIARGEWQFDGYITSDCDGTSLHKLESVASIGYSVHTLLVLTGRPRYCLW